MTIDEDGDERKNQTETFGWNVSKADKRPTDSRSSLNPKYILEIQRKPHLGITQ